MATRVSPPQNKTYYINPAYLTFVENSGYGANLIQVSASSSCYISVYDPSNGIGYSDADRNYKRWKVTAYNNKFPSNDKFYIYVRLEKDGTSALVVYDTKLRGVKDGLITVSTDENGNEVTTEEEVDEETLVYYYIRIGEVGATDGTSIREITYDTGYLTSDEAANDKSGIDEMWELDKYSTPWLIKAKQWLRGFTVKGLITLIGELAFSKGKDGDEKLITDVKRSTDSDEEYLRDEYGEILKDENGSPIPNPDYVSISDETIPTTAWVAKQTDWKYLRKDQDDRSSGTISSDKGFEVGEFIPGLSGGVGAKLYQDENRKTTLEVDTILGRDSLIVPTITYNCTEVVLGETAQTFAFGIVKEVTSNTDGTGIIVLDLLEDEFGTPQEDDICRGIFHFIDGGNSTEYSVDGNGFHNYSGYSSSYFTPQEILVNEKGSMEFKYSLQNAEGIHPCKGMKFYAYGNFTDKNRQSVTYQNREYTRRVEGVSTWVLQPDNIVMQDGNLEGLEIGGQDMSGYSSFQKNIYLTGSVIEFTPQQEDQLRGEGAYSVVLSSYVGTIRIDDHGKIMDERHTEQDFEYYLRTVIQVSKGSEELFFSDEIGEGSYKAVISPVGCKATLLNGAVFVTEILEGVNHAYIEITVSCEGYATIVKLYEIKLTQDGVGGFDSMVFTRTNDTPATPTGGSYDSPVPTDKGADGNPVWSDGIPDGSAQVWMSKCHFVSDGSYPDDASWSTPRPMTDTADFEVIYSPMEVYNEIPDGFNKDGVGIDSEWESAANAVHWYDNPDNWKNDDTNEYQDKPACWMATNTSKNGVWQGWKVARLLGEKGDEPLALMVSTPTISRNSFGSYEPAEVQCRSMRGNTLEKVIMTAYGIKQNDSSIVVSSPALVDTLIVAPAEWAKHNLKRLVFRAYTESVSDYEDSSFIAENTINYIGDGHSGPMSRNRGEFQSGVLYYYNERYRDFVWYNDGDGDTKVYMRDGYGFYDDDGNELGNDAEGGIALSTPADSVYWIEVPKTVMTAIDTALIENANIAGFMFQGGRMVSQDMEANANALPDKKLILDGTTGFFKCVNAQIDGSLKVRNFSNNVLYGGGSLEGYAMGVGSGVYTLPSLDIGENRQVSVFLTYTDGDAAKSATVQVSSMYQPLWIYDEESEANTTVYSINLAYNTVYTFYGVGGTYFFDGQQVSGYWIVNSLHGGSVATVSPITVDTSVVSGSENPVSGGAVYSEFVEVRKELDAKIQKVTSASSATEEGVLYIITTS